MTIRQRLYLAEALVLICRLCTMPHINAMHGCMQSRNVEEHQAFVKQPMLSIPMLMGKGTQVAACLNHAQYCTHPACNHSQQELMKSRRYIVGAPIPRRRPRQ